MFYANTLNGPELATLLAALGLVVNASVSFYLTKRQARRSPQPARVKSRRDAKPI